MRQFKEVRQGLRRYTPLKDLVGIDADGEVKVYTLIAKSGSTPPYLIVNFPPVNDIEGAYGEDVVMETFGIQLTAWALELSDAMIVATAADDALRDTDFDVSPYEVDSIRRTQNPFPQHDPDAQLWGVVTFYEMTVAL